MDDGLWTPARCTCILIWRDSSLRGQIDRGLPPLPPSSSIHSINNPIVRRKYAEIRRKSAEKSPHKESSNNSTPLNQPNPTQPQHRRSTPLSMCGKYDGMYVGSHAFAVDTPKHTDGLWMLVFHVLGKLLDSSWQNRPHPISWNFFKPRKEAVRPTCPHAAGSLCGSNTSLVE